MRLLALVLLPIAVAALPLGSAAMAAGCPTTNPPNTLRILGGSPQTAQLGQQFQSNLQVALANTNGCPLTGSLGGTAVRFVAPATGASGTFVGSGSNSVTVGSDATGTAIAPPFRANDSAGSYEIEAVSDYGTVKLNLTNTASGVAASIASTGLTEQVAFVNTQYGEPLQIRVLDANGAPVQGVSVAFSLGTGTYGAGASFVGGGPQAAVATNASGIATSPAFVANGSAGRFIATASVSGLAGAVTFGLDNRAAAASIDAVAPAARSARVHGRYAKPLQVLVRDVLGRPVEGATVTFTLPQAATGAGATFVGGASQAAATTDAAGRATSPALVANGATGSFAATATVSGGSGSTRFVLRNLAGRPASIAAGSASGESARVGTRFPIRLAVTVTDADGNPVSAARVTFTAPAHGPGARFGTRRVVRVKTDRNGVAVAPVLTANRRPGGYVVTAGSGAAHRAAFALVNTP
jgi:protocatechuate 3,4-dioxygenase beta subunit